MKVIEANNQEVVHGIGHSFNLQKVFFDAVFFEFLKERGELPLDVFDDVVGDTLWLLYVHVWR